MASPKVDKLSGDIELPDSPTRAPAGWAISLSLSRARRALKVEVPAEVAAEVPAEEPIQVPAQVPVQVPVQVPIQVPVQVPIQVPAQVPDVLSTARSAAAVHSMPSVKQEPPDEQPEHLPETSMPPLQQNPEKQLQSELAVTVATVEQGPLLGHGGESTPTLSRTREDTLADLRVLALEQKILQLHLKNLDLTDKANQQQEVVDKLTKDIGHLKKESKLALEVKEKKISSLEWKVKGLQMQVDSMEVKMSDLEYTNEEQRTKIAQLTFKLDRQKENLSGVQAQLEKLKGKNVVPAPVVETYRTTCRATCRHQSKVYELENQNSKLRTKMKNQTEQLANLTAAFDRARKGNAASHMPSVGKVKVKQESSDKVLQLEDEVTRLRTRNKNQRDQLAQLTLALQRAKTEYSEDYEQEDELDDLEPSQQPAQSIRVERLAWKPPQQTSMSAEECVLKSDLGAYPFELRVFKVLSENYFLSQTIMQHFEETSHSLPTLRPAFRAVIAGMPPATRTVCMEQVRSLLPQPADLLSSTPATWAGCLNDPAINSDDAARMAVFWGCLAARQLLPPGSRPVLPSASTSPAKKSARLEERRRSRSDQHQQPSGSSEKDPGSVSAPPQPAPLSAPPQPAMPPPPQPLLPRHSVKKELGLPPLPEQPATPSLPEPAKPPPPQPLLPRHSVKKELGLPPLPEQPATASLPEPAKPPPPQPLLPRLSIKKEPGLPPPPPQPAMPQPLLAPLPLLSQPVPSCLPGNVTGSARLSFKMTWSSKKTATATSATPKPLDSTANNLMVSYPSHMYKGAKYPGQTTEETPPSANATADEFGCQLPPHLQPKKRRRSAHEEENIACETPSTGSRNRSLIDSAKKRILAYLQPTASKEKNK